MFGSSYQQLGTVAVLCLQGQIVTGETESLRAAVSALSGAAQSYSISLGQHNRCRRFGRDVGVARAGSAKGIRFALMKRNKRGKHRVGSRAPGFCFRNYFRYGILSGCLKWAPSVGCRACALRLAPG